jgi:hydrogenase maturation protease HycI
MCWRTKLNEALAARRKVAVLGVGHELRGDDSAGVAVARGLKQYASSRMLVIDAGAAPENYTGPVRRFSPDLVLLVDAAQMDAPPGAVRWLDWQQTTGLSASTHTMPPYMLAKYLVAELGCEVALLGIQPADMALDAGLSDAVQRAIGSVIDAVVEALASLTDAGE